jgi:hypothetical protein
LMQMQQSAALRNPKRIVHHSEMRAYKVVSYSQVRFAWCKAALVSLLRRWGIYVAAGLLILGGSGTAMMAIAAWAVTPLFQAAQHSIIQGSLLTLGYALLGGAIVLGLSPWLWPRAWAEAEQALPIDKTDRRRSDVIVVLLALTPLFTIYALGTVSWFVQFPVWLQEVWARAILMFAVAMALAVGLGTAVLERRRTLPPKSTARWRFRAKQRVSGLHHNPSHRLSAAMALVILPMLRGPAQRSGRFFAWTLATLVGCVLALFAAPRLASWWLAAFAALAQAMVTRLNVVVAADMEPLHEACSALPISPSTLKFARRVLVLAPLVAGQLLLSAAIGLGNVNVRSSIFATYLLASLLCNLALVIAVSTKAPLGTREDPAARASWWLVTLVLSIALASEVVI